MMAGSPWFLISADWSREFGNPVGILRSGLRLDCIGAQGVRHYSLTEQSVAELCPATDD